MPFNLKNTLFLLGLFLTINTLAQNTNLPYSVSNKSKKIFSNEFRNIELTFGYVPSSDNNALKGNIAINNLVLKRLGAYTSVEYGLNTRQYYNTIGPTLRINNYAYLWGGMDLFSSKGLIQGNSGGFRKEFGIGFTPYKIPYRITVVRVGWSTSIGITFSAGLYIPF
jgi:hypothetical protein